MYHRSAGRVPLNWGTGTPFPRDWFPLSDRRASHFRRDGQPFRVGRVALIRGTDQPLPRVVHPFLRSPVARFRMSDDLSAGTGIPFSEARVPLSQLRIPLLPRDGYAFTEGRVSNPFREGRVAFSRGAIIPFSGERVAL